MKQPLEQLAALLTGLAQQLAATHIASKPVLTLLSDGLDPLQAKIEGGLKGASALTAIGVEVFSLRISDLSPIPDLAKALQTPTREPKAKR